VRLVERAGSAQAIKPVLVSESNSTRALALESVTRVKEPFSPESNLRFGTDRRTRIQLMVMHMNLETDASTLRAEAEDGDRRIYPLVVEHVGPVKGQEWLHSVTIKLNDEMGDVGDVLIRLIYKGVASNRVRVGIGHVGGGPPDDAGAVPTPVLALAMPTPNTNPTTAGNLTTDDVRTVISQAVSAAVALNQRVTVAVVDREGNVLGVFAMTGAATQTQFRGARGNDLPPNPLTGLVSRGLAGTNLPSLLIPVQRAAISKAGTAAFFSTFGSAFTPRTASFIIQEHFPPGVNFQPGGPLYGVQFSQLPCTDIKLPNLPFGLAGDPGAVPLYKNGVPSGGVAIEGDGIYTIDPDPTDFDKPLEEVIAVAAGRGYEPPALIRGDNIIVGGVRLPYVNVTDDDAPRPPTMAFGSLPGLVDPLFPIRAAQPSAFVPATVGGVSGAVDTRFFPFITSPTASPNRLSAAEVNTIIGNAARQADITRAAIRQPLGSAARVSITVVDVEGNVLGIFRTTDAPVFGFDVSAQKARSSSFISRGDAGSLLRAVGLGSYADRAGSDSLALNGAVAFTDRAFGFLHRPFYPDGINFTAAGPFSTEFSDWNVFNVGVQSDAITTNLVAALVGANVRCTALPQVQNGFQIFAGGIPLYKGSELVGGIGISGDGIDQDDIIASAGAQGFAPPVPIRSDQFIIRGTRLPFVKFPRSPNL
jgi:uncharacterized protein GlcG (DUF336 family)